MAVSDQGRVSVQGVSAKRVVCSGSCACPGGVCLGVFAQGFAQGGLPRRVSTQGVSARGGVTHWEQRQTPPITSGRHP